jgi:hypothetical protein
MGYDFDTICHILNITGFTDIRKTMFQESMLSDIQDIEPYAPLRAAESLCVECIKHD